jgi:predicted enzyme related to lactoylglutathione lyase
VDEQEIPGDGVYTMFTLRDRYVAATNPQQDQEKSMGIPPHWNSYVTVEDAEQSAKAAESAGGTILAPAFDVMDSGRMSVFADPTGAVLSVWQPNKHIGAGVATEPNSLSWNELMTTDVAKAKPFYQEVFGWGTQDMEMSPDQPPYTLFQIDDKPAAGMMQMPTEMGQMPSHWAVYFEVADIEASVAKLKELGGQLYVGPQSAGGVGTFAAGADPQGAAFSMIQPDREQQTS